MSEANNTPVIEMSGNQQVIPGSNVTTLAPNTGVAVVVNPEVQKAKFSEIFSLEGEVVGHGRSRVSKKGAVRFDLMTMKDIGEATGLKGDALKAHVRDLAVNLKSRMAMGFAQLASDPNWVGRHITMNAAGDAVTFQLKKVAPVIVKQIEAPKELTPEELAAKLGVPVEAITEMLADKARKEAEELAMKQLEAEEAAKNAAPAAAK